MDEFDEYINLEVEQLANKCKEIFQDCIDSEVYDKYDPISYQRTYQLRDKIRTDIKDGVIYVYVNIGDTDYTSNKPNSQYPANQWTPYWVNYGHNTDYASTFMYDNYPSRGYLQKAQQMIRDELGLDVTIIEND